MDTVGTFTPDKLLAGDFPKVTEQVTIVSGASIPRGGVLGKITASGKCTLVDSAGTDDGRRAAYGVLLESVDATAGDKVGVAALSGEFNSAALTFGGEDTAATHRETLRDKNIYLRSNLAAV